MNRQDFQIWTNRNCADQGELTVCTELYNLLSKEISEKDEEIAKYGDIASAFLKVSDELLELRKFKAMASQFPSQGLREEETVNLAWKQTIKERCKTFFTQMVNAKDFIEWYQNGEGRLYFDASDIATEALKK